MGSHYSGEPLISGESNGSNAQTMIIADNGGDFGDRPGVMTNGRVPTLTEAKARFVENLQKCRAVGAN